jgi:hypothetical protein
MTIKAAMKKKPANSEFQATFDQLKALLTPYATRLKVVKDTPDWYYLETKENAWRGKPVMFAAVRKGKAYVSYYLMSVYMDKNFGKKMSKELEKRRQGKSCFNFSAPDATLFAELKELTDAGAEAFRSGKMFEAAAKMKCD